MWCKISPVEGSTALIHAGWTHQYVSSSVCWFVRVCLCVAATSSVPGTNQLELKTKEQQGGGREGAEEHWWQLPSHDALCSAALTLNSVLQLWGCLSWLHNVGGMSDVK